MTNEVIIVIIISLLFIIFLLLNLVYYLYKKMKILETQINLMIKKWLQEESEEQ